MARGRWTAAAFKDYPKRYATPDTVQEGQWLRHAPTKTWLEFYVLMADGMAVGFDLRGNDCFRPLAECYHSWDPNVDGTPVKLPLTSPETNEMCP
jgi:hypothetical protein